MIIIDDIERCLDYTPIGPRFSNQVLQALLVLIKKIPPVAGRSLMVVGITSIPHLLEDMELTKAFDVSLECPLLQDADEYRAVLKGAAPDMGAAEVELVVGALEQREYVGVKKLLMILEMSRSSGEALSAEGFLRCVDR
jgi:vesicle-fusing ATPase